MKRSVRCNCSSLCQRAPEIPCIAARKMSRAGRGGRSATNRRCVDMPDRSEEHTSELQSLMRISYDVFCLKKKTKTQNTIVIDKHITNKHETSHKHDKKIYIHINNYK